jgi:hypothetical protein
MLAVALVAAGGCKKKEEASSAAVSPESAAAPAALAWKAVGGLGLEAEVPAGANIVDKSKGAGYATATIWASPPVFVQGAGDMSDLKPTIEKTKDQLARDPNKMRSVTREEKTADGWILEVEREAMIDKTTLYGVSIRRTISGKPWNCGTNARTKAELAKVVTICQSLRAAK